MTYSGIKNLEEVGYNKKNWLKHQKPPQLGRNVQSKDYLILLLYISWSITEKFTVVANFTYHVRLPQGFYARIYHLKKCFNSDLFYYSSTYVQWQYEVAHASNFSAELEFFGGVENFDCHIRLFQGFLH